VGILSAVAAGLAALFEGAGARRRESCARSSRLNAEYQRRARREEGLGIKASALLLALIHPSA
jgi:hypothetical protein